MTNYLTETEKSSHLVCLTSPCALVFLFVEYCVEFVPSSTLERPGRGSRRMLWELAPGDVIGKPVELQSLKIVNAWKRRKHKLEKASRRAWTE